MALILDGTDGITSSGGTNVLQDDAVITANIADGAVVAAKIADGAVSDAKIAAMAATKLTGDVAAARITTALNAPGSAPIFAARAWVNFNGTNASIRGSGNVSSVTRHATGEYTVNFTTAMPDANYSITSMAGNTATATSSITPIIGTNGSINTGSFRFRVVLTNAGVNNASDAPFVLMSVFR